MATEQFDIVWRPKEGGGFEVFYAPSSSDVQEFGDSEGHPFRGNQWTNNPGRQVDDTWKPHGDQGTTVGGISTNLKELGLSKETTRLLNSNWKSKGFTINKDKQAALQAAKDEALTALGTKLGWTPEQIAAAVTTNRQMLDSWRMAGGTTTTRSDMEAAWVHLREGGVPTTDMERAVTLQKAYTDMVWDTKHPDTDEVPVIRGVSGTYAGRIALADALGEDWSARTYPLTSWATPDAERSVDKWVVEGVKLGGAANRDETLAIYSGEPGLRETGLKVKGEYIVDGEGALDNSSNDIIGEIHDKPPTGYYGGSDAYGVGQYVAQGKGFAERTGGSSDDYALGRIYDQGFQTSFGTWPLNPNSADPYSGGTMSDARVAGINDTWKVLGFDEPPEALSTPDPNEHASGQSPYDHLSYAERQVAQETALDAPRKEVADALSARGHTPESLDVLLNTWSRYRDDATSVVKYEAGLKMPIDPKASYGFNDEPYAPRDQKQADYWRNELIPNARASAESGRARLESLRSQLGIDDVPLPNPVRT